MEKAGNHSFEHHGVVFSSKWKKGPFGASQTPHILVKADDDGFWVARLDSAVAGIRSRYERTPQGALLDLELRLEEISAEIRQALRGLRK